VVAIAIADKLLPLLTIAALCGGGHWFRRYSGKHEKHDDVDKKDCYFDEECHAKVDWEKIGEMKKGFFKRMENFAEKDDKSDMKILMERMHAGFAKAGMPEDRIDYILNKWAKFAWEKNKHEKHYDVDKKDCYFDKECHAKVDWEKIGEMKTRFFDRMKILKEKNDPSDVKVLMKRMHFGFAKAGMPEDRIDYILIKWVKNVYPDALDPEKPSSLTCKKFEARGGIPLKGCYMCHKHFEDRVDDCMQCGRRCFHKVCKGDEHKMKCAFGVHMKHCHKKCMSGDFQEEHEQVGTLVV